IKHYALVVQTFLYRDMLMQIWQVTGITGEALQDMYSLLVEQLSVGFQKSKVLLHFQQQKQSMLLLQRLVKKLFGYKDFWMNWVRGRSWAGYTVIARVTYILQRTLHFIPR